MSTRGLKVAVVATLVVLAGLWFAAPYWTVHQMREAARDGDADRFNTYVDYPTLRENMTAQLTGSMGGNADPAGDSGSESSNAAFAIGRMLGKALATGAVQALVRPEVIMRAMQYGQWMPKKRADSTGDAPGSGTPSPTQEGDSPSSPEDKLEWWTERSGLDKVTFYAHRRDDPPTRKLGLVLERRGWASWQLTDIRIPSR